MKVIDIKKEEQNTNSVKIVFCNSVGIVLEDEIYVFNNSQRLAVSFDEIRTFKLVKKEFMLFKYLFFILGVAILFLFTKYRFSLMECLVLSFVALAIMSVSFTIKNIKYRLFLAKKDSSFEIIKLNKYQKEDAKSFVKIVAKKIKELKST